MTPGSARASPFDGRVSVTKWFFAEGIHFGGKPSPFRERNFTYCEGFFCSFAQTDDDLRPEAL